MSSSSLSDTFKENEVSSSLENDVPPPSDAVDTAFDTQETQVADGVRDSRKQQNKIAAKKLLETLYERFPKVFMRPGHGKPVVLAVGLHKELQPLLAEWGFDNATLRMALSWYTRQLRYQRALIDNTHRIALNGEAAEEITEEQKKLALEKVTEIENWLQVNRPQALMPKPKANKPEAKTHSKFTKTKSTSKARQPSEGQTKPNSTYPKLSSSASGNRDRKVNTTNRNLSNDKLQSLMEKFNQH